MTFTSKYGDTYPFDGSGKGRGTTAEYLSVPSDPDAGKAERTPGCRRRSAGEKAKMRLRETAVILPLLIGAGLLLLQEPIRMGVREGLVLCGATLIPALFPFMVMSDLLSSSRSLKQPGRLSRAFGQLFGLSDAAFAVMMTGALYGVPLGARETVEAYRSGKTGRRQAEALLPMASLCGPAFVIAGVGGGMRKSIPEGIWLFAIQLVSSLLSGLLLSFFDRRAADDPEAVPFVGRKASETHTFSSKKEKNGQNLPANGEKSPPNFSVGIWPRGQTISSETQNAAANDESEAGRGSLRSHIRPEAAPGMTASPEAAVPSLPRAIRRAATDLLSVCGSVCLFSAFGRVLLKYLPRLPAALLYALSEVTGGASLIAAVFSASPALSFSLSCAVIAFGGMSIHLQTALFTEGTDLRLGRYFLGKTLSAVIAFGLGSIVWMILG